MTKEQRQYNGTKIFFSTNGAETTGHPHAKKMNLNTELTLFTKINSKLDHSPERWLLVQLRINFAQSLKKKTKKQIIDLKVKCETIKLLEDSIGENLNDLG